MRNLKKVLALVLALVMAMSLVTIANADFTDASAIGDEEAVTVMTALGIIEGNEDGSFNPDGTLTREQAAKIIAYILLGPTAADKLGGVTAFTDVPATRWSAGYISYCASLGIIAGNGDGTFSPTGKLTGYAFAKMLLTALGYDASIEGYVGSGWQVNVAAKVVKLKLNDGVDNALSNELTREEACRMALNALSTVTVGYQNKGTTVTTGDTTVEVGNTAASTTYGSGLLYKTAYDKVVDKWGHDIIGANNNEGEVSDGDTTIDVFGRKAGEYKINDETLVFAIDADLSYTEEVSAKTIYKDLGLSKKIAKEDVTVYTDGSDNSDNPDADVTSTNTTDKFGGNGTLTEVFYDSDANSAVIVVINTYADEVLDVDTNEDDDDLFDVEVTDGTFTTSIEYAEDDVVIYTKAKEAGASDYEIQTMALADSVEGEITRVTRNKSFVLDGTTYEYSAQNTSYINSIPNEDQVVYLDAYGYAIYTDAVSSTTNYAYVAAYSDGAWTGDADYQARLLLADGTVATVDTKDSAEDLLNQIVTYTVNSDDVYTLTSASAAAASATTGGLKITKGTAGVTVNSATANNYFANSKTVFFVYNSTDKEYSAYVGIANVPSMEAAASGYDVATVTTGNTLKAIFVSASDDMATGTESDVSSFIYKAANADLSKVTDNDLGDYYVLKAVVDGEATELMVDAALVESGALYNSGNAGGFAVKKMTINDDDIVTAVTVATSSIDANGDGFVIGNSIAVVAAEDDVITVGASQYTYADDVVVFQYDISDKAFSAKKITSLKSDNYDLYMQLDGYTIVALYYVVA